MPSLRHRPGDLIQNRYEVRKLLGSGAFGTVYGCRDTELNIPVAVKEMHVLDVPGRPPASAAALRQFRSEATHLSRLRHPHIVSGHYEPHSGSWEVCPVCGLDFSAQGRCPDHGGQLIPIQTRHYLVMEYIGGPDLLNAAYEAGGKLPVDQVVEIARDVAGALAHIHARSYVHRDIKPENIRLRLEKDGHTGEAVLLDFGIATEGPAAEGDKYGTRVQRHTQGGGTEGYAPESPDERRDPDARSDIHAFGMTLYHLLTQCDPTEPTHLREMRRYAPVDFVPEIPPRLNSFILACIERDPLLRPQHGAEALSWLTSLDEDEAEQEEDDEEPEDEDEPPATILLPTAAPAPVTPFLFRNGAYARNVAEMARLMDENPEEGARYLANGELERWLFAIGEADLAESARTQRQHYRGRPGRGLEMWIQATGWLDLPQLEADPDLLDFGKVPPEGKRTLDLYISNPGRGRLFGVIESSHPAVSTTGEWDGNRARIAVTFDAFRMQPGPYGGELTLRSSAGAFTVPFQATVRGLSGLVPFWTVVCDGAGGMLAGGLLRALPFYLSASRPGWSWLHAGSDVPLFPVAAIFGLVVGCVWMLWMSFEAFLRRSCGIFLFGCLTATMAASAAVLCGGEVLKNGDLALRPIFEPFLHRFAAGAWMSCGALAGTVLGTLRRAGDLFTDRIGAILLGWLVVAILLASALIGASTAPF